MRGIAKGETCTKANPILQLVCRSGGFLADLYSGSYLIQDIRDPTIAAATVVTSTLFVAGTHKVAIGRYALATGATTGWNIGTHRAVCTYKMASGGPDYTQIVEFEVLDSADWPTGNQYTGYLSTRSAYVETYVGTSTTRQKLHRWIDEVSRRIEMWTGRWFDPRFIKMKKRGQNSPTLLLQQPIIALEDTYAIWQTTTGQDSYKYEQYLYKVYNRHLDGFLEEDDRCNPLIELTDVDGTVVEVSDFSWPYGNQNIELWGVFGYTDPEFDPNNGQILIGKTPVDISRAVGALVSRINDDPTMTSLSTWSPGSLRSMRTRDQSITFGGSAGSSGSEPSGDPLVDGILIKYCQPPGVGGL